MITLADLKAGKHNGDMWGADTLIPLMERIVAAESERDALLIKVIRLQAAGTATAKMAEEANVELAAMKRCAQFMDEQNLTNKRCAEEDKKEIDRLRIAIETSTPNYRWSQLLKERDDLRSELAEAKRVIGYHKDTLVQAGMATSDPEDFKEAYVEETRRVRAALEEAIYLLSQEYPKARIDRIRAIADGETK